MAARRGAVVAQRNKDGTVERHFISADSVQKNLKVVHFCRTFMSIIAGVVAGILGLTNIYGFVCYFVMMALVSLRMLVKTNFQPTSYFMNSSKITYDGVTAEIMTFVLFWTLFYDIVHIYG
mmetsp:Transcript_11136/g.21026  ORF Transcript_11136/g.21026 Transcript_11136/m.21026 type:complete len:121 (+) Transcript_11136:238-600(+)